MAEFVEGFETIANVGKAVTIFGSARTRPDDFFYQAAEQTARLAPALTEFLGGFRNCLGECRLLNHFATYCRGLLSDLRRKSVEPIALAAGCTVRALQMFLSDRVWDHLRLRDRLQQHIAALHAPAAGSPRDGLGVIGLIDETSVAKKGDQTPGVQRQYCGSSGKIDNGIVTVHLGYAHGEFKTLLDCELFLPESWSDDRHRCREAGIPDHVLYRPKTAIVIDQVRRAIGNGIKFDWLVFDEGYGKDPAFLFSLDTLGQTWIGEVPKNFRCWTTFPQYHSQRKEFSSKKVYNVVRWSPAFIYQDWQAITFPRQSVEPIFWDIKAAQVHLVNQGQPTDRSYWLIVAWNRATDEYKYFVSNAPPRTHVDVLLKVAFGRAQIEHLFRLAKDEIGLDHFEGRSYVGLMRHMILCQLMILFLAEQTQRLNARNTAEPHADVEKKNTRQNTAENAEHTAPPQTTPPTQDAHPDSNCAAGHHGADRGLNELALRPLA